jgi:hypothetical protein
MLHIYGKTIIRYVSKDKAKDLSVCRLIKSQAYFIVEAQFYWLYLFRVHLYEDLVYLLFYHIICSALEF